MWNFLQESIFHVFESGTDLLHYWLRTVQSDHSLLTTYCDQSYQLLGSVPTYQGVSAMPLKVI